MSEKILVVDDDEELSLLLAAGMRGAGYEVLCATDGEKGLSAAREFKPDLISVDLNMPRMHGWEFCKAVRSDGDLARTKIMVLTGKKYPADERASRMVGADAYMHKPYVLDELLGVVRGLLAAEIPAAV